MRTKTILVSSAALAGVGVVCAGAASALLVKGLANGAARFLSKRLQGKVVLITGGSRGLGLALAEEFGRRGAKLVLTARDEEELQRARWMLLDRGVVNPADILLVPADLRQPDSASSVVDRATERFGHIDILINNAGIITVGPIENQTAQDFHDVMDSNFFSGVHCALAVVPQMLRRNSGTIVNIASIGGKVAVPHLLPYSASKFAAVGFSEGLNAELRSKGIHVLTVCPGLMRTGSHLNALFTGNAPREYRWFSLFATLPGASATAASAARRIVRAILMGENEIAITPQAILASRFAAAAPGLVSRAMGAVNRILPRPLAERTEPRSGAGVRQLELIPAARLGWAAARRYNQTR
jgi:short-subunit dehydrogenase